MNKEFIIHASNNAIEIALFEDKLLVEFHREQNDESFSVGDVYLGRVHKIMLGLSAVFVDIGADKAGFLHYLDLGHQVKDVSRLVDLATRQNATPEQLDISRWTLGEETPRSEQLSSMVNQGQNVLVQISKEAISTKGPRITGDLSIAGRYLVLIPFSNSISVSTKIRSSEERNRLRYIIQSILPKNFGVIIRTVAEGKTVSDIDTDLKELLDKWKRIIHQLSHAKPPKLLLEEQSKAIKIIQDLFNADYNQIVVDNEQLYDSISRYLNIVAPEKKDIVKFYKGSEPIFDHYNVTKQIKSSFGKLVPIRRGGAYLVIEHTEALHVIDVNSGHKMDSDASQEDNALTVNLEAATEIARQLRLRDIGGIIVVDFIDQRIAKNRHILFNKMIELMKNDNAKHNILPPSKFGLIQITRQRIRQQTSIEVLEKCPVCDGTGSVRSNLLILDDIVTDLDYLYQHNHTDITLEVNPFIYAYLLHGFWNYRLRWWWKYRHWLKITKSAALHYLQYRFLDATGEQIKLHQSPVE
ncbi:ribonuclease G [Bacteroidia bacterium]|nr:ribonuclease G [Bacteroidia bacterium]